MSGRLPVLRDEDLDSQTLELLPPRETLFNINVVNVIGVNLALAINAASFATSASALAGQQLAVVAH